MNPGLEIVGVGPVKLPLKPSQAKSLIAAARVAPFGKGTKTLIDTMVLMSSDRDSGECRTSIDTTAHFMYGFQHEFAAIHILYWTFAFVEFNVNAGEEL